MSTGLKQIEQVTGNGQEIEVTWYVKNKTNNVTAHNVLSTFSEPVSGLLYVSHIAEAGTYNTATKKWLVNTLYATDFKYLKIKYKITDISALSFSVLQTITADEGDAVLENNLRRVFFMKASEKICDPIAFTTPAITISDDNLYEHFYIGDNDTVDCPCCTKEYSLSGVPPQNVTVIGFGNDSHGFFAKIMRGNPALDSFFDYTVTCKDCVDNRSYPAGVSATVKINKLYSNPKQYVAVAGQAGTAAPTAYVNLNTLGGTVVWSRSDVGKYVGLLSGAFLEQNTLCRAQLPVTAGDKIAYMSRMSANTVGLYIKDINGAFVDADVNDISLFIEVWTPAVVPSPTPTVTPSFTPTVTPSISETASVTPTVTVTPTQTSSVTPTPVSPSVTPSLTPTNTVTPTVTPSLSETSSVTPTVTQTPTVTPSISESQTVTPTPSVTPSISVSTTGTPTPTVTPSLSVSQTITPTPSITPSISVSVTMTPSVTPSLSESTSVTPTVTPSVSITPTPSPA